MVASDIGIIIVGLIILCFGGYALVLGSVALAKKLQISSIVIGLTVVAYGTSTPELAASIVAAIGSHTDLIIGNIVGSNISNVGMVIGISAIFVSLKMREQTSRRWVPIMILASFLLVALSLDGEISQIDGVILLIGLIAFSIYTVKTSRKKLTIGEDVEHEDPESEMSLSKFHITNKKRAVGAVVVGAILLGIGGHLTVNSAVSIAEEFGISQMVIGITIIAIGTSLPELVTSIIAIRKKQMDIGIGNIVGSNIYNILFIGGIAGTIAGIPVITDVFNQYIWMIGFSLVLFIGLKRLGGKIPKIVGCGLAIMYIIYLGSLFVK
jgi:cation:H+ antiporter